MKISLSFEEFTSKMGYVNSILGDKSVEEKLRNIIFLVEGSEVRLVAYNAFTFVRSTFENAEVDLEGHERWNFQIKAGEVNKIISAFSNLYKTKVSGLEFSDDGVRIKLVVHEVAKEESDSRLNRDSGFLFETAPLLPNIESEIKMDFPSEIDMVSSADMLLYLDSLYPLLTNDTSNGIGSKINFAKDYVFVISTAMSSFMVNKLPEAFQDLCLTYSSSGFLKKMTESSENIGVARIEKYLCIQEGNTEAFMKYQKVKVNYSMYVNKRSKDKGFVVDRLYMKDVLRRMATVEASGVFKVEEDELAVSNSNFNQSIPLNNKKEADGVSFNISIPVFEKVILGKDDVFTDDLFVYFVDTARGYLVFLSDSTGAWFSSTQVTKA